MSTPQHSPWPNYPDIPIFLDTDTGIRYPTLHTNFSQPLQSPEIAVPSRSVRYFRAIPPPTLRVPPPERDRKFAGHGPRRPPLRYFLDKETPSGSSEDTELGPPVPPKGLVEHRQAEDSCRSDSSLGLGIRDAPEALRTATSSPMTEKEDPDNFAQRIEKRFWRYNSSRNVVKRWLLEIISWFISAVCMGAILVLLFVYKDKRQPGRLLGLTLNAYVAVLSKIASAALLLPTSEALGQLKWSWFQKGAKKMWDFEIFDNASRGPWGSVLLLIRTKGR